MLIQASSAVACRDISGQSCNPYGGVVAFGSKSMTREMVGEE